MSGNNQNQNKFIVDNLLVPEEVKKEEVLDDTKEIEEESIYNNPYFLDVRDEKYFKLFIGNNYSKITEKRFNFAALLFGGIYLIYRKCYLLGIVWTIINLVFLILLPLLNVNMFVVMAIILISHVICGFVANFSYVNYVGMKIVEYRSKDKNNLKNLLITHGGTNLVVAIISFIIVSILYVILLFETSIEYLSVYNLIPQGNPKINEDDIIINTFKYDGELKIKEDVSIKEIVSFPSLVDFQNLSGEANISYLYGENAILPKCKMDVNVLDYNITADSFIKGVSKYYNELDNNIKEINSKNKWYTITIVENTKEIIYNATVKDHKLLLYRVTYTPENKDVCLSYYNNVINEIE